MLKNLLKTWEILAPDVVRCDEHGLVWLKDPYSASLHIEPMSDGGLLPFERFILQGYIQQCIQSRGWTTYLQVSKTFCACEVVISFHYHQDRKDSDVLAVMLTAYLEALAAQRPITTEYWRHFKPETPVAEFTCVAHWGGVESDPYPSMSHLGFFALEEDPTVKVRLAEVITSLDAGYCIYIAEQDYGDRVFYHYGGDQFWARLVDNFLGLVGSEHPEHEGLLRFVEVTQ